MTKGPLDTAFSGQATVLTRYRKLDQALNAACQDFEDLAELKSSALKRGDLGLSGTAQISLDEVRQEIEHRLRALARGDRNEDPTIPKGENL